ncbi:MAG: C25 family cysteine peptidase, partial [Bacteroidota bacterium]
MKQTTTTRLVTLGISLCLMLSYSLSAQMTNGLYGNEWIDFDRSYFKVTLSEDGIYRINRSALESAGIPVASVRGEQFRLIWLGEEVPIYTTTNGIFGSGDFIEFYGRKNRSEFDRVLFENPDEELLNPDYSMFTDQSAYYLTWEDAAGGLRVQDQANDISNPPAKETHFSYTHLELFTISGQDNKSFHVKRTINGDGGAFSYFDVAEGFGSEFATGHTVIIAPRHVYGADNASSMRVRFASDNLLHRQTVSLNGDLLFDETFTNFTVQDHTFDINTSDITSTARVQLRGIDSSVDRLSIASIRLTYPRFFNFDNNSTFQFEIAAANTEKYLEIKKFDLSDGGNVLLYDLTNNFRLQAVVDGDVVKVVLPPSSEDRQLVLMNVGKDLQERTPQRVEFIDYSKQPEADYFIITHKSLFDDGRGNNYVQQYADYRASQIGGDFKVMIVEIGQLYDQFAYGVETHPLSIRNFGHFIDSIMPAPRYAFIIGKGREYSEIRREEDKVGEEDLPLLVPTYGIPGSDAMLFSDGRSPISRIPVGRLAANNGQEVNLYLKKVKAFEANVNLPQTIEDRAWMKRIIHLGGGGTQEQALIRNNLEGMENIIETNLFGGEVTGFYKNSSDPVQISTSEQIFNLINGGVSMITFFGHSGANTFDFNIDNPDNYRNKDKYPLMFSLGCHIGNIHTHFQGVSERFTFDEDAGAIGFGASSSLGFIFALNRFSRSFYDLLGGEMYGASIGDIQKETVRRLFPSAGNGMLELLQQFTFHADPAIRMNPAPGPDYVVDPESVKFEPGLINAQLDEFDLSFTVMNIGRAIEDSIVIRIEQQFPDGSTVVPVLQKIAAPAFKTDLTLSIPVYGRNSVGQNKLFITVDATNEVEEVPAFSAESNNELVTTTGKGIPFFVIDNGVLQLYPKEYAIVGDSDISLLSSTLNALSPSQKFFIEIDTTALFNSPLKRSEEITQEGGIIRWKPQMNWTDETVYYWRVSPDSTNAQIGFVWENSSFLYLSGAGDGWNQSHYFQYLDSRFDNMTLDSASRAFTFGDDIKDVRMINKVWDPDNPPQYFNDNSPWRSPFSWTINEGVQVMVRRDRTLRYWLNTREGLYGSINGKGQIVPFPYHTNTEDERADLMTLLEDVIPDGDYVILYTVLRSTASDFSPELWAQDSTSYGKNIFSLLEEQGATQVRRMKDLGSVPYVLIYKKGEGVLAERIGESIEDIVSVDIGLPSSLFEGQINSTLVGPASKWTSLQWQLTDQPNPQADTASIHIYGVD